MSRQFCPQGHDTFVVGRGKNGKGDCRHCAKERTDKYRQTESAEDRQKYNLCYKLENSERLKEKAREYHLKNKARRNQKCRDWYKKNQHRQRAKQWASVGIVNHDGTPFTHIDYDRLYQVQSGRCPGCLRHQSDIAKTLVPDHDHKTGFIRGLLCDPCNHTLGNSRDSAITLRRLADFLERRNENENSNTGVPVSS